MQGRNAHRTGKMKTVPPPHPRKPETSGGGTRPRGESHVDAGIPPPRETAMVRILIIIIATIKIV